MSCHHIPRMYRSPLGCCICRAKSSSSRFTDTKKYEDDFPKCFALTEPRQGKICNACVLLVKRFKKLPPDTNRNWHHVVDARAGPGMKSMSKFKKKNKKQISSLVAVATAAMAAAAAASATDLNGKKNKTTTPPPQCSPTSDGDVEMAELDFSSPTEEGGGGSGDSSRTMSPGDSDCCDRNGKGRRQKTSPMRRIADDSLPEGVSDFLVAKYWKKKTGCCGTYFKGKRGEVIVDSRFFKPCLDRQQKCKLLLPASSSKSETNKSSPMAVGSSNAGAATKLFSDNSSDSGYDESSYPGATAAAGGTGGEGGGGGDSAFK